MIHLKSVIWLQNLLHMLILKEIHYNKVRKNNDLEITFLHG